jgi:hypothetical protein
MYLHIGTTASINSSALEVVCPPPGIGAKKVQESSDTNFGITYIIAGNVAQECGVVDLHIGTIGINSATTLEVACPPPEHGRKFKKILQTITPPLTTKAVLVAKVESWITRAAS